MNNMIIVFCGVPGCGKSTIAELLTKELKKEGRVKVFVSDKVKSRVYEKALNFLEKNSGKTDFILLDATFYRKKWRDEVFKKTGRKNVLLIYLRCSLKACLKRNKERKPQIPEKAVHIIFHQMEEPENPDILIDTEKINPKEAVGIILEKLE